MPRPPSSTLFPYTTLFRSYLSAKIVPVTDRGLRGIRNIVGHHDGCQVFTVLLFPGDLFPSRAGTGVRSHRGGAGTLNSCIPIGIVVVTNIKHSVPAFHGARKRLKTDIISPAVSSESNEADIFIIFPLFFQ